MSLSTEKYPGEPICILSFETSNLVSTYDFNTGRLKKILSQRQVMDRNIVVISIVGAFRKGKSFLLDYCLRYLYTNYKSVKSGFKPFRVDNQQNWMGDKDEPLQGFSWKYGSESHTTGIIIWSDIFLYDAPNDDKIAILLMDTQGLFDHKSSPTDNSRILSLSTLMASMQIYNLSKIIHEDQLQYLQFATDMAKFVTENNGADKPFQNLMFLIRDWQYAEESDFGLDGGQELLNKVLKIEESQLPELQSLREYLKNTFEKISCFLMPFPGEVVSSKKDFDGRWSAMDQKFLCLLKEFVEGLLSPKALQVKKINGEVLTSKEYCSYIEQYVEMYKSDQLPEPLSIYEANVTNHMKILLTKASDAYNDYKQTNYNKLSSFEDVEELHKQAQIDAFDLFNQGKKLGTEEHDLKFQAELGKLFNDSYEKWRPAAIEHVQMVLDHKQQIEFAALENQRMKEENEKAAKLKEEMEELVVETEAKIKKSEFESKEAQAEAPQDSNDAKKLLSEENEQSFFNKKASVLKSSVLSNLHSKNKN